MNLVFHVDRHVLVNAGVCQSFCSIPGPWIVQETNICYGAKNRKPATIIFKRDCQLHALRLRHVSGNLACWAGSKHPYSKWGCIPNNSLIVTYIVKNGRLWYPEGAISAPYSYKLNGFNTEDDLLIIKKSANFTAADQLQVWYSEDWFRYDLQNNVGRHCIDVDISCLE